MRLAFCNNRKKISILERIVSKDKKIKEANFLDLIQVLEGIRPNCTQMYRKCSEILLQMLFSQLPD